MYHLTPTQALFLTAFLIIIFMAKGFNKGLKKASGKIECGVPEIDEPLRNGYSFLYCMEMRKREMMYRDGEWVPMYVENDKKNWYIQDKLRKKDIALNKHGRLDFIGKTREMLENNNAI